MYQIMYEYLIMRIMGMLFVGLEFQKSIIVLVASCIQFN